MLGPTYADRRLGRFKKFTLLRATEPKEVHLWVPVGGAAVSLIAFGDPPRKDVDGLLDSLGAPEEVQHNLRFRTGTLGDELVYASRGLNLSVATPHADVDVAPPPAGRRSIVHVQLFRPTTVDMWRASIGATVPLRPFPLR